MQPPPVRRRSRQAALLIVAGLLLGAMLGGCAHVRASLAVYSDDTVTGEIVVATPTKPGDNKGPTPTVPPALASAVTVSAYKQDGYTGSVLRFSNLSFDQTAALTHGTFPQSDRVQLNLRRVGGRILVTGSVDLTSVPLDQADFELKMSFPGRVVDANGEVDGDTVSWTFTPGDVGDIAATVAYADPGAPSVLNWTLGLGAVVAIATVLVAIAARRTRNPPLSPPVR